MKVESFTRTAEFIEIAQQICEAATKTFAADHCAVVAFAPDLLSGEVVAEYPAWDTIGVRIPVRGIPAEERLLKEQVPIYAPYADQETDLGAVRDILRRFAIASLLILPIVVDEQVLGSFSLDYRKTRADLTPHYINQCRGYAAQVALTLRQNALLERLERTQVAISAIAQTSLTVDLAKITQAVAENILHALPCDLVSCYAYDQDAHELFLPPGTKGLLETVPLHSPAELRQNSIIYEIMLRLDEEYYETHDAQRDPLMKSEFVIREGIVTSLCCPLIVTKRIVGVLFINYRRRHPFARDEYNVIRMFAHQAVVAIDNALRNRAQREGQQQELNRTLQRWLSMLSSEWSHEIAKRVTTISYDIDALRDLIAQGESHAIQQRLAKIERLLQEMTEERLTLPLTVEEGVESVLLYDLLYERLSQLWIREPYRAVKLERRFLIARDATVRVNADWMKYVIDVLVENAVDAMRDKADKQLIVETQQVGKEAHVSFIDSGAGIPPELQLRVFHEPIPKTKGMKGGGINGLIARTIVETYRGRILIESTDASGTRVTVILPLE